VDAVSSIDIGKIIGTIVTAPMNLLDNVNLLGPLVDAVTSITGVILDVIVRILEIAGPLLVAIGPMLEILRKGFGSFT
jgi:hypothetical protein